ncbi:hypothetical protein HanIR_Chr10g0485681 [Helianthus annuus]|nr:hypothetical protein HanIR_Chr10g0485681 [Helianthus annuus]
MYSIYSVGANEETRVHRRDDLTALYMRVKNHTLFFLLNLDLQWRREESGAVEIAGRRRFSCFQLQKVWWLHMLSLFKR